MHDKCGYMPFINNKIQFWKLIYNVNGISNVKEKKWLFYHLYLCWNRSRIVQFASIHNVFMYDPLLCLSNQYFGRGKTIPILHYHSYHIEYMLDEDVMLNE